MTKQHHVVHNPNGGWDIKRNNAKRASYHGDTKFSVTSKARIISEKAGTELIIHGKDGKIQRADSHGPDPCPPKDKG